ncbi:MAG: pyruvate dehydrogenase E2 component (dihydrolipoamide acetyltransferase) [Francisellaceae bacterium]|jgi:pyruvate dehydrogenase E2 component (dihydrolipoamide acetyltransferase)
MALIEIKVPDIGDYNDVDIIEIGVSVGDTIAEEDSLITVETDKASMEIPAPQAGVIKEILVKVGDKVSQDSLILKLETEAADAPKEEAVVENAPQSSSPTASSVVVEIKVPDIGDYAEVDIIEVTVKAGDTIAEEDSLITVETDKASMEIPSPQAGVVQEVLVSVGDKISEGGLILKLTTSGGAGVEVAPSAPAQENSAPVANGATSVMEVQVPDIGDYTGVDVIEVNVNVGDTIAEEDSLITVETDKASMEIPAPAAGVIKEIKTKVGDKVSQGDLILTLESTCSAPAPVASKASASAPSSKAEKAPVAAPVDTSYVNKNVHAGPSVRRLARVLGADLSKVKPSGRKGRITKEDCEGYIKSVLTQVQTGALSAGGGGSGLDLLADPKVDFSKFGEIKVEPLSRIGKLSAKNLHRNWVKIPHVTFYDDADITDMEAFRKANKAAAEKAGVKVSPLAFLIKAAAVALKDYPKLNSSLSEDGENIVYKQYYNIGFAADTPKGLIVPVIKDADKKGIYQISQEMLALIMKGREGKIKPDDMKGASFTISSLGILGTTGFTPIINMPEVAIMGVSKTAIKPVYNGKEFVPRSMLPLSLSVDHRVIDGALAAKFLTRYSQILADLREMLL